MDSDRQTQEKLEELHILAKSFGSLCNSQAEGICLYLINTDIFSVSDVSHWI